MYTTEETNRTFDDFSEEHQEEENKNDCLDDEDGIGDPIGSCSGHGYLPSHSSGLIASESDITHSST